MREREYMQSLQVRQRWTKTRRNLMVNDVVIVKDYNLPRNSWRLSRVIKALPGNDGLVRKVKLMMADSDIDNQGKRTVPWNLYKALPNLNTDRRESIPGFF